MPERIAMVPGHAIRFVDRGDGKVRWTCECGAPRHADFMPRQRAEGAAGNHLAAQRRRRARAKASA